ncbi:hypothetical protein KLP40_04595 [Hymenobacter sp. NST-14]|uniref:hypothetical protein n=1 Tax=Hymenobacter piscis TaxID=2839984 RepID=UPI001C03A089|nr:hypothetical protein [Hymenobacter piscis]MBT9392434.1 hypothetical protein [Hymenobacter piscis]
MKAPLPPVRLVPPHWVRTTTASGAFSGMSEPDSPSLPSPVPTQAPGADGPTPPVTNPPEPAAAENAGFRLLPPPPAAQFAVERSEDGRLVLGNEGLELDGELFAWRELEAVDVQPVRWLLGVLLGAFSFCGFLLGFLQYWLRSLPAALGMALGVVLMAWGGRGTNRWRLHRPGQEARHFALSGGARSWQRLAQEANQRIRQRHHEAAATAAYYLQRADYQALPPAPESA